MKEKERFLFRAQTRAVLPEGLMLHGSSMVRDGNAAVFLAPSGGGKSTIAAKLAEQNFYFLAEDTVIIADGTDGATKCLPCGSLKLSTGREDISPALLKVFVFLEKGKDTALMKLSPEYAVYRARRINSIIAMSTLKPEEREQAGNYLKHLFEKFPSFVFRYSLETDPSPIVSRLLNGVYLW